jgi:hypothetical protein
MNPVGDQFSSEGGIGFEYVRDLHSDLSSAVARRHSSQLPGGPLRFRSSFVARPHIISRSVLPSQEATAAAPDS